MADDRYRQAGKYLTRYVGLLFACFLFDVAMMASPAEAPHRQNDLPHVLIIGDSISIGYTSYVQEILVGKAHVTHNPGNAKHTGVGLEQLDRWLGDTDWDVIHFNWGLWDLCYRHPESNAQGKRDKVNGVIITPIGQYQKNLEKLVVRLKKTNAKLIWANTSYVPEGEAGRKLGDDLRYNLVASEVMNKYGIETNDLNALTRNFDTALFIKPGDVHYTEEGYREIGKQVGAMIYRYLPIPLTHGFTPDG